jgi:hypothetical protein
MTKKEFAMKAILMVCSIILFSFNGTVSSAQTISTPQAVAPLFSISIKLSGESGDKKGTDVLDVYNVRIDFANKQDINSNAYNIIYYLDDIFQDQFKNQTLPFVFKKNFKGQRTGKHVIRIVLEDQKETQVAENSAVVYSKPRLGKR